MKSNVRNLSLILLLLGVPTRADEAVAPHDLIVPTILLPKRLQWGMSLSEVSDVLSRQAVRLSNPQHLTQPEWLGDLDWTRAQGYWPIAFPWSSDVRASYYFSPDSGLECLSLHWCADHLGSGSEKWSPAARVLEYATAAHQAFNAMYGHCTAKELSGHSCQCEDELGYRVSFRFELGAYDNYRYCDALTIEYSSKNFRDARSSTDEF